MTDSSVREFQVERRDLTNFRVVERPSTPLADGEIRLGVDAFAFTANNITYGAAGDFLGYWQFFPAADNADNTWGILPVWGFADVVESTVDSVPVGDRLYGYFPPATSVVMVATEVSNSKLIDGSAHRQKLPPLYNRYQRVSNQEGYDKTHDDVTSLLAPLHLTSFCLVDQLEQNGFYGATQVVVASASSKTSLGTAFGLSEHADSPRIIGLTSERNRAFVEGVGLYDHVVTYDTIADTLAAEATVVIDMAGNPAVTSSLANHLGDALARYIAVGITHWDELAGSTEHPRPQIEVEQFFAPGYIVKRITTMDMGEFDRTSRSFVQRAALATSQWMTVQHEDGLDGLAGVYGAVVAGEFAPSAGLIIQLAE